MLEAEKFLPTDPIIEGSLYEEKRTLFPMVIIKKKVYAGYICKFGEKKFKTLREKTIRQNFVLKTLAPVVRRKKVRRAFK